MYRKTPTMAKFRLAGVLALAGLILLVVFSGIITANQERISGDDIEVQVEGDGIVDREGRTVTVWESEPVTLLLGPTRIRAGEHYIYCLDTDEEEYGCQQGTLQDDEGYEFEIPARDLPRGRIQVNTHIFEDNLISNDLIETVSFRLETISKNGDEDNDGLSNQREMNIGTEYDDPDSDGDGLDDGEEVNQYNSDPLMEDTDRDGLSDEEEVNEYGTDPTISDTDSDGLDDGPEVNEHGTDPTVADTDGDGFDDGAEIQQGSDPTDVDDTPRSDETDQPETNEDSEESEDPSEPEDEPSDEGQQTESSQDQSVSDSPDSSSEDDEVQRGFFTNNPDSGVAVLQNPFNITMLGFLLSIAGIFLQLRRGV
jgi:hypothetical protein